MPTEQKLIKELHALDEQREALVKQIDEKKANRWLRCEKCEKRARIRNTVYRQIRWYTRPHGCTGGDYWNDGEGQWQCTHCAHVNRLYKKPEIEKLKRFFLRVEYWENDGHGNYRLMSGPGW